MASLRSYVLIQRVQSDALFVERLRTDFIEPSVLQSIFDIVRVFAFAILWILSRRRGSRRSAGVRQQLGLWFVRDEIIRRMTGRKVNALASRPTFETAQ